jgi:hypothetical protein
MRSLDADYQHQTIVMAFVFDFDPAGVFNAPLRSDRAGIWLS